MICRKQHLWFRFMFPIFFPAVLLLSGCSLGANGARLFSSEGCSQCHFFKGKGGEMAPDLTAVTSRRSDSWIESYLQDPKAMNPNARMPSFRHLSSAQRKAIIDFLKK